MTSNQVIQFIGKCLTLNKYPERKDEIQQVTESAGFSWEHVVFNASNQFVLPAWYIQMKKYGLLSGMSEELLLHLEELTSLNRERNREILLQVREIATLLNKNYISPVFLKGTAHLLLGLYNDPAERMVGDIDFLVPDEQIVPAAELVKSLGFEPLTKYNAGLHSAMKHFPRMVNYNYPAAVEIHREVVNPPDNRLLKGAEIFAEKQEVKNNPEIFVPSNRHLILHNILNAQINDKSYQKATTMLRQRYDFFLLAERENLSVVFENITLFKKEAEAWLATTAFLFDNPKILNINISIRAKRHVKWFAFLQKHHRVASFYRHFSYFAWRLSRYIFLPVKAIFDPVVRAGIIIRLTDKTWYGKHIDSYRKYFHPQ